MMLSFIRSVRREQEDSPTEMRALHFIDSAYIDGVITVFMILFGINFNLYFLLLLKDWKSVLKNEELECISE